MSDTTTSYENSENHKNHKNYENYEIFYWPILPGRGEFIRLIFEEAGVPYTECTKVAQADGGGMGCIGPFLRGENIGDKVFAPPILRVGELTISQLGNISLFLARRFELLPPGEAGMAHANQLMLTFIDVLDEVHNTHHPLGASYYHEDQIDAARKNTSQFLEHRLPRFLRHFEAILTHNGGEVMVGGETSYVDLALFQLLSGLEFSFPNAFVLETRETPQILALRDRVAQRPRIASYLKSDRHVPFNEHGIFRHYSELDFPTED